MTAVPGATSDAYYGASIASLDAALSAACGDLAGAAGQVDNAVRIISATDDAARLTARRADPAATRIRAERIRAAADGAVARIARGDGSLTGRCSPF